MNKDTTSWMGIGGLLLVGVLAVLALGSWLGDKQSEVKRAGDKVNEGVIDGHTLVIGTIGVDEEEEEQKLVAYTPLIEYLKDELGEVGVGHVEFRVTGTSAEMAKMMRQKEVDLFIESPFSSLVVANLSDSEPLVSGWRKGKEKYRAEIFTAADSGIKAIEDLPGQMICFQDPNSTSGYLLPKAELLNSGYKLTEKTGPNDSVAADEIGYYFAFTDERVVGDALDGVAAACATKPADIAGYLEDNKLAEDSVTTLLATINVYQRVAVVRSSLDPALKVVLKQVLLGMENSEAGQAVLDHLAGEGEMDKFGEFSPSPAVAFAEFVPLADLVEQEILGQLGY